MTMEKAVIRNVMKNYGPRTTDMKYGGRVDTDALFKVAVWDFNYDSLPTYGTTDLEHVIPAGSTIVRAYLRIITAFTSTSTTTDLDVGLYTSAGVAIDADGLITVAEATQTAIGVANKLITGAGALVGLGIGASDGEVVVTPNVADLTAGRGQIIVEYLIPVASPAS